MRRAFRSLAFCALTLLCAAAVQAAPVTVDFTEVFNDPDGSSQLLAGNEWAGYGLSTTGAYWAHDTTADPFDGQGIVVDVNPPDAIGNVARVTFAQELLSLEVDWFLASFSTEPVSFLFDVYAADNSLLASSNGGALSSGSFSFSGFAQNIKYVEFYDSVDGAGQAGVSTLRMDTVRPIPEPSTIALLGLGGLGLVVTRLRRRRSV